MQVDLIQRSRKIEALTLTEETVTLSHTGTHEHMRDLWDTTTDAGWMWPLRCSSHTTGPLGSTQSQNPHQEVALESPVSSSPTGTVCHCHRSAHRGETYGTFRTFSRQCGLIQGTVVVLTQTSAAGPQCVRARGHNGTECTGKERENNVTTEPLSWRCGPVGWMLRGLVPVERKELLWAGTRSNPAQFSQFWCCDVMLRQDFAF